MGEDDLSLIDFDTPFPHCPRHLGMAEAVRSALRRDERVEQQERWFRG